HKALPAENMKPKKTIISLVVCAAMFIIGCNSPASNSDQSSTADTNTVVTRSIANSQGINNGAGDTIRLQQDSLTHSRLPHTAEKPLAARVLNEADKIYIDLIVPDYPDVILFHEGSAETLNYVQQVYGYLRAKNASIRKKAITQKPVG